MRHSHLIELAFLAAFMAGLSGCALTNPTDPYAAMAGGPRAYAGGSSRSATTQPTQGPLTLGQVIRVALANNPKVAATAYEVDAAQAQGDLVTGQRLLAFFRTTTDLGIAKAKGVQCTAEQVGKVVAKARQVLGK